jgi:Holliday junction resolvase
VKGSRFESDLENYLNESGMKARRLPRAGAKDIGDVAVILNKLAIIIEAKNVKKQDMAEFLRQADVESCNYEIKYGTPTVPVVVTKTRQKSLGEARVTLTLDNLLQLLRLGGII